MSTKVEVNYEALEALSIADLDVIRKSFQTQREVLNLTPEKSLQIFSASMECTMEIEKRIKNIFTF